MKAATKNAEQFQNIDKDGNGTLSYVELQTHLKVRVRVRVG